MKHYIISNKNTLTKRVNSLFAISLFLLFVLFSYLHYKQIFISSFESDWGAHVVFSSNYKEKGFYSLLHFIVLLISKLLLFFFSSIKYTSIVKFTIIVVVSSFEVLTILLCFFYLYKILMLPKVFSILISIGLSFVSMLILKLDSPIYLGTGSPNVWHNPTFNFSKPFSIVYCLGVLHGFRYGFKIYNNKLLVLISLVGILCVWAKPSFFISFLPSTFIVLLFLIFRKKIKLNDIMGYSILVIPPLLILILINLLLYNNNSSNNIIITNGDVWRYFSDNILLSILFGILFPLVALITNLRKIEIFDCIVWINYIFALIIFYFLCESGNRKYDGNFGWTYSFSIYFLFLGSIESVYKKTKLISYQTLILLFCFISHLISGLVYFFKILLVGNYK